MENRETVPLENDRALVRAMLLFGEPPHVIEEYLECLDIPEADREELRRLARGEETAPAGIASGDVIEMNPLTAQPQRSKQR
jgi:hypothetical protein